MRYRELSALWICGLVVGFAGFWEKTREILAEEGNAAVATVEMRLTNDTRYLASD